MSGILANLYLHSFDCWVVNNLSQRFELRYVRYADDFVILLKNKPEIAYIHKEIQVQLNSLDLRLHDLGSNKTKYINITKDKMKFIGFLFDGNYIRVNEENIDKFKKRIESKLKKLRNGNQSKEKLEQDYNFGARPKRRFELLVHIVINRKVNGSGEGICQVCGGLTGEKIRSWIGFFSAITDTKQLHELDKWIRMTIGKYFWERYKLYLSRADFRNARLASLEQEYYRIRKKQPCQCKPVELNEIH